MSIEQYQYGIIIARAPTYFGGHGLPLSQYLDVYSSVPDTDPNIKLASWIQILTVQFYQRFKEIADKKRKMLNVFT